MQDCLALFKEEARSLSCMCTILGCLGLPWFENWKSHILGNPSILGKAPPPPPLGQSPPSPNISPTAPNRWREMSEVHTEC